MLQIYTDQGWLPINNAKDYYTDYEYGGEETLHFSLSPEDDINKYLFEEVSIKNEENIYIIKKHNQLKTSVSFDCYLNMEDWKSKEPYKNTKDVAKFQTKTLSQILDSIKPNGWKIMNSSITAIKRTPELECVNDYEVLWNLQDVFSIVYRINTISKTLEVLNPDDIKDRNLYITKELNMESNTEKGDSENFVTRLYCEGKDGITFSSINNGKNYVECFDYSNKIVTALWKDERYTIKENLLKDANKKLEKLCIPSISYTISFKDLARVSNKYEFLNFGLYDIAHTFLENNVEIIQRVVKYRKYHDNLSKSILTLSSEPKRINKQIQKIANIVNDNGTSFQGSIVQQAQQLATDMLTTAMSGYVVKTRNELFIMDTDNPDTAKKVWRWNLNGLGYSSNGIKGPYSTAITADGRIVADFITAGVLRGIQITNGNNFSVDASGNMTAKNGSFTGKVNASNGNIGSLMITENGLTFKGKVGYPEYTTSGIITKYGTWTIELNPDKFGMFGSDKVCMTANFKSDDGAINAGFDLSALALKINHVSANSMESYSYTNLSEKRFKKLIKEPEKGLDVVLGTDVKTFRYKGENDDNRRHCGFVIGDGYNIHKSLVAQIDVKGETVEGVDLYTSIGYAYKAIQELKEEIDILKKEVHK